MLMIGSVFALIVMSLIPSPPAMEMPHVHKDFKPFVEEFVKVGKSHGKRVSVYTLEVVYGPTDELFPKIKKKEEKDTIVLGYCTTVDNHPKIVINPVYWANRDDYYQRRALMFHEMGHCLLDRGHKNDKEHGLAESLMNWLLPDGITYGFRMNYYDKELFTEE